MISILSVCALLYHKKISICLIIYLIKDIASSLFSSLAGSIKEKDSVESKNSDQFRYVVNSCVCVGRVVNPSLHVVKTIQACNYRQRF